MAKAKPSCDFNIIKETVKLFHSEALATNGPAAQQKVARMAMAVFAINGIVWCHRHRGPHQGSEMGQTNFGTFTVAAGILFFYYSMEIFAQWTVESRPRGSEMPYF